MGKGEWGKMKTKCAKCGKEFETVVSPGLELVAVCMECLKQEAGF
jgi:DNA-directed RNA polymerase subunit RPC12/RpoP